jgi:transposase
LIFQDEAEIHLHPTLTRMWARSGTQPEVPTPGKNQKRVVYGGVNYATGRITYTVMATKSGWNFIAFLVVLLKAYAGRKIRLVCDNARFHHTQAVQAFLAGHVDRLTVFWLPPYCPDLNLIERVWGHIKRTALANVLYRSIDDLVVAFKRAARQISGNRKAMRFVFKHDDVTDKAA